MNLEKPENSSGQGHNDIRPPARQPLPSRRKLVRGGLIGAPTLLALKSTPVLAANCKLPSGFSVSGNFSQTNRSTCLAPAPNASFWNANATPTQKDLPFVSVNTFGQPADSGATTFGAALSGGGVDALIVAAWINAAQGNVQGLTTGQVRDLWDSTANGGTYPLPNNPTVRWTRADVIDYLNYLMP